MDPMTAAHLKGTLDCRGRVLRLDRTLLMGVVNVTPDSFSDGGLFLDPARAVEHARRLVEEGADILDVGAESSRPGSDPVTGEDEWARLEPVLCRLLREVDVPVSVDTYKPQTARRALEAGAHLINDIGGLADPEMIETVAKHDVPAVIMHMKGRPKTMQQNAQYGDVVEEVKDFLIVQARRAQSAGIRQIIIDPGIGFGKNTGHNIQLLRRLGELAALPYALLVGPSRKSFLGNLTGAGVADRLGATLSAVTAAVLGGADIVRVHEMKHCRQAVLVADAIRGA
jgi:dihydropteroate synthase